MSLNGFSDFRPTTDHEADIRKLESALCSAQASLLRPFLVVAIGLAVFGLAMGLASL